LQKKRGHVSGSLTVEAAILMPVLILLMCWVLHLSIGMYGQVEEASADIRQAQKIDSVKLFRSSQTRKDLVKQASGAADGEGASGNRKQE
jgi:Flp pilus assembly protein TadG